MIRLPNRSLVVIDKDSTPDGDNIVNFYKSQGSEFMTTEEFLNKSNTKVPYLSVTFFSVLQSKLPDWNELYATAFARLVRRGRLNLNIVLSSSSGDVVDTRSKIQLNALYHGFQHGTFAKDRPNLTDDQHVFLFNAEKPAWDLGSYEILTADMDPLADYQPRGKGNMSGFVETFFQALMTAR